MEKKPFKKTREGRIVSDKMDKTIVVAVIRKMMHPFYKKVIKKTTKFKVHDEENKGKIGDLVRIIETRPLSKDKRWRLVEILGSIKTMIEDDDKGMPSSVRRKKEDVEEMQIKEGESVA